MNYRKMFIAIVAAFALAILPIELPAQTSDTAGGVTGRVKNAVTDQYLGNARVSVAGTDIVAFTAQDGTFRLAGVPSGEQELVVQYTGLDPMRVTLDVPAGSTVTHDVGLTSVARYGTAAGGVVQLDEFQVTADRELNAQTVATNEQRYAPNIKTALATDSFGSMMANSVGEFMKFIPGVSVSNAGNANEITEFAVRGIGGAMSSFTQDGAPMVFGSFSPASRIFNPYTSDINNTARVEVTKVPRPSDPADSIGGSINMVSKSAFDQDRPVGHITLGLNVSGRFADDFWKESPVLVGDRHSYKALPNGSFDYSLPINDNFGIFFSGLHFPKASLLSQMRTPYVMAMGGTTASQSNPLMGSLFEMEGPRTYTKTNFSFKADWRVTEFSTLSFNVSTGENKTLIGNMYRNSTVGGSGISTVAGGTNLTYGDDFTSGATGRGAVQLVGLFQEFNGGTTAPSLTFRHDDGRWRVEARASYTDSYMEKDNPNGNFATLTSQLAMPARVSFTGLVHEAQPRGIEVFDNAGNRIDINDIANYRIVNAVELFYRNKAKATHFDGKVNRRLEIFSFPSSIEVGAAQTTREYENRSWSKVLTYNGPDGNAATLDAIPESFLVQHYRNRVVNVVGGGFAPFISPDRVWDAWMKNPNLFTMTPAQVVAMENTRRRGSQNIEEVVDAAYIQGDARLLEGRLQLLGGVRFEKTTAKGSGVLFDPAAVWERDPDGSFARTPAGARIRRAAAGAVGSMEELTLTTLEGGARSEKSYDGYYPSIHMTYNIRDNLLVRAAYASTFGRPDYNHIIPGNTIVEADLSDDQFSDPDVTRGTITINNTGLKPWTADNYDLSLEYYSKSGGLFTVGVFLKDITDFFGSASRFASQADLNELGLDSRYLGWIVNTRFNSGSARVRGVEVNFRQPLSAFGDWGRNFAVFANGTKLKLDGANDADFSSFTPETANWGVSYGYKRLYAGLKWNYTGEVRRAPNPAAGPGGYYYFQPVLTTDVDLSYSLTPRLTLALSVANLTNEPTVWHTYSPLTPSDKRHYLTFTSGSHWSLALRGTF